MVSLISINHNKTVFNGSDLGKAYSAKAILERFSTTDKRIENPQLRKKQRNSQKPTSNHRSKRIIYCRH
jgi:hypothetical protein